MQIAADADIKGAFKRLFGLLASIGAQREIFIHRVAEVLEEGGYTIALKRDERPDTGDPAMKNGVFPGNKAW